MKTCSEASERNKEPILRVLRQLLPERGAVLEIGSGSGQHAVFFAAQFPNLSWQTTDLAGNHDDIRAWVADAGLDNLPPPLELDVSWPEWPVPAPDAVFSANTAHIMSWPQVEAMFAGVGRVLKAGGKFCLYGPFNYDGDYTSGSNADFDRFLKHRDPDSGLRDFEAVNALARDNGLDIWRDYAMPANNHLLVWKKPESGKIP